MLRLEQIPMRNDNYSYALIKDNSVIMIDPSEEGESAAYFQKNPHLRLKAIINTHSHNDHVGGNALLFNQWQCPIYGPLLEENRIPNLSYGLSNLDRITILGIDITAHDVRAHTSGHMAYVVETPIDQIIKQAHNKKPVEVAELSNHRLMFVGDSLFGAGCGRLFEGTPKNLFDALSFYNCQDGQLLMACAHEYTKANLDFAKAIFPLHQEILERAQALGKLLEHEGSSTPCFFELEQKTNPFLLALREPFSTALANKFCLDPHDLVSIVASLRKAKDNFQ